MLLALSTLGCPELSLAEAAALAEGAGYAGLELRSAPGATVEVAAPAGMRRQWRQALARSGIHPLSVASYVRLCDPEVDDAAVVLAGIGELRLAHDLGAEWVRVFPGAPRGEPTDPALEERAGRRLAELAAAAAHLGVRVALETHDSHRTADDVLRLVRTPECDGVAIVWDVLHTWLGGEVPTETARLLRDRLGYVQVKDVAARDDLTPVPLGTGVVPLALTLTAAQGLTEWVSWEYERVWYPEVAGLDVLAEPARRWLEGVIAAGDPAKEDPWRSPAAR